MMNYYYLTKVLLIFLATDDLNKLKGYSDIDVSVLGLKLLQTSLFLQCIKKPAESRDRDYSCENRAQTDQKWWITKGLGQTMHFVVRRFVQALVSTQQLLDLSGEWEWKTKPA